jgi:hypothetical protein
LIDRDEVAFPREPAKFLKVWLNHVSANKKGHKLFTYGPFLVVNFPTIISHGVDAGQSSGAARLSEQLSSSSRDSSSTLCRMDGKPSSNPKIRWSNSLQTCHWQDFTYPDLAICRHAPKCDVG